MRDAQGGPVLTFDRCAGRWQTPRVPGGGRCRSGSASTAAGRRFRGRALLGLLGLAFAVLVQPAARGQTAPELGYLYPPVVQAGSTVPAEVGGYDLTPDTRLIVRGEGVAMELAGPLGPFLIPPPPYWFGPKGSDPAFPIPREFPAKVTVAQGTPPGPIPWQVANANGASAVARLWVSSLSQILEDRYREEPQTLPALPVGVSGRLSKIAEVDRYVLVPPRSGLLTVRLLARTLGSDFHGMVKLFGPDRELLADLADPEGNDLLLTRPVEAGKRYTLELHDLDFRGNRSYVYHLELAMAPRVVATAPARGVRGTERELTFLGIGLASGTMRLERVTRRVTFPAEASAASYWYALKTDHGTCLPVEIPLSEGIDERVAEGMEGSGQPGAAAELGEMEAAGGSRAITGELPESREVVHRFQAAKGETWQLSAEATVLEAGLDLELEVRDADGKSLATNDDAGGMLDPALTWKPPADGQYQVLVRDLAGGGGELPALYRLALRRQEPGFTLRVPPQLNCPLGGKATLEVTVEREGGFAGPVVLEVSGLPPEVTPPAELVVAEKARSLKIPLEIPAAAAAEPTLIRVSGTATIDGRTLRRTAVAPAGGSRVATALPGQMPGTLAAVTIKPPFQLLLVDKNRQRAVHRGTTYPAPFVLQREAGFAGPVRLRMAAKQGRHRQGIWAPIVTVPADASEVLFPCFMPEWLATDRTTRMVVQGVAEVPDGQGKLRHLVQAADARVTMILEGALLTVSHEAGEMTVGPGDEFAVPLTISRSPKLPAPVTLQLDVPAELHGLLEAPDVTLPPGTSRAQLAVRTEDHPDVKGRWKLRVTARTLQDGKWLVLSETAVVVDFAR